MRYIMKLESGQRGLLVSCDWKVLQCEKMEKFMPIMAINKIFSRYWSDFAA